VREELGLGACSCCSAGFPVSEISASGRGCPAGRRCSPPLGPGEVSNGVSRCGGDTSFPTSLATAVWWRSAHRMLGWSVRADGQQVSDRAADW
jgi:hypothetical protein